MRVQPFGQRRPLRQCENAAIPNNADTVIAVRQRDDPHPPAVPHQMVRGAAACGADILHQHRMHLAALVAVQRIHIAVAAPEGGSGVLISELTVKSQFFRQQGCAAGGIDDPSGGEGFAFSFSCPQTDRVVPVCLVQRDLTNGCRPEQMRPGTGRKIEHMLIEQSAIKLIRGQAALKFRAQLGAVFQAVRGLFAKPHPQAVLLVMMRTQIIVQVQHAREKTGADLRSGLADLAIKLRRALHHQNAQIRCITLQQQGGGRSTEGTADDDHIVVCGGWGVHVLTRLPVWAKVPAYSISSQR